MVVHHVTMRALTARREVRAVSRSNRHTIALVFWATIIGELPIGAAAAKRMTTSRPMLERPSLSQVSP